MKILITIKKITILIFVNALFATWVSAAELIPAVDLRDLVEFSDPNTYVIQSLITEITNNPCKFVAPLKDGRADLESCNHRIKYLPDGALGPNGKTLDKSFKIDRDNENVETRTNTVLSAEFSTKYKINPLSDDLLEVELVLFIHDELQYAKSDHYFFRKVKLNYNSKLNKFELNAHGLTEDIPIAETNFSFYTDIVERKTIAFDIKSEITKVFPVAVGALDVRTFYGMDDFVGSMTVEMTDNAKIFLGQGLGLYESRIRPWYYKGRPFLGILDNNGSTYKEIGYHYKIDEGPLVRGFVTHGCIRVRDKDLYQMSAMVFSSQGDVSVKVVNSFSKDSELKPFASIEHPYPKTDVGFMFLNYAKKNYLDKSKLEQVNPNIGGLQNSQRFSEVEQYLWCHQNGLAQPIRYFGEWASALDNFCLTKVASSNQSVIPFIKFILGDPDADAFIEPLEPAEPILIKGLCNKDLSMSDAVSVYFETKGKELTFGIYVDHCGCKRFKNELGFKIFKSSDGKITTSKQVFEKYCLAN